MHRLSLHTPAAEPVLADVQLHKVAALLHALWIAFQLVAAHVQQQQGAVACKTADKAAKAGRYTALIGVLRRSLPTDGLLQSGLTDPQLYHTFLTHTAQTLHTQHKQQPLATAAQIPAAPSCTTHPPPTQHPTHSLCLHTVLATPAYYILSR